MTTEQQRTIEAVVDRAIGEARSALPNGNDEQLTEWVMEHLPSFTPDIEEAMAHERLKNLIRESARNMGVTLQE